MKVIEDITGIDRSRLESFTASVLEEINPGKKVLIIIPDYTRVDFTDKIAPLIVCNFKKRGSEKLHFLNACGTHRAMTESEFLLKIGLNKKDNALSFHNHNYSNKGSLISIGSISSDFVKRKTNSQFNKSIPVKVNKLVLSDYDTIIAISGTSPHEASGYSGGLKIFFPGVSAPEVIDLFHWSAVLIGIPDIIGTVDNNARDIINEGSKLIFDNINCDVFTFNMVTSEKDNAVIPNGLYVDRGYEGFIKAYNAATALSSKIHVKYIESSLKQAVQVMPRCYDEVWTAAKGSYKLQKPGVMADGGEIILYGPHISCFHSDKKIEKEIQEAGYHCKDYIKYYIEKHPDFCRNSAAHLINVSGSGEYDPVKNIERCRFRVTLATGIPEDICKKVNLGYRNPDTLRKSDFAGKEKIWIEDGGKYLYELRKN